jgi:hypothetical protein
MKAFIFKYYILFAILTLLITFALWLQYREKVELPVIISVLGIILTSIFFVQKQKLEELRLFKELFQEFNERYDKLNRIIDRETIKDLTSDEKNTLYDYFNLCGEEYLFYKQGYILPEVWKSWINGMMIFYKNKSIRDLWEKELKNNSYYGFKLNILEE